MALAGSGSRDIPHYGDRHALSPYEQLSTPIWIFDIERHAIWWANASALTLWEADSLEELLEREFQSDSRIVHDRLEQIFINGAQGQRIEEIWTLYPKGTPKTVSLSFMPVTVDIGARAVLIEGSPQLDADLDPRAKRILEAVRHTPLLISTFSLDGTLLAQNPASVETYGESSENTTTIESRYNHPGLTGQILERVRQDGCFRHDIKITCQKGERWHTLTAEKGRDPVTGDRVLIITEEDVTQRIEMQEALARLNQNLERRVQERTEKLVRAQEAAEAANKSKSNFLATMSHELRTPLNAIIGFAEMLGLGLYGEINPRQKGTLEDIRSSAQHLLSLINELLDASTLETGEFNLHEDNFSLDDVVYYCQSTFELECQKRQQQLSVINNAPQITLYGDSRRFRQILINLLGNASKFTPEEGCVGLEINQVPGAGITLQVSDTGIGIPEKRLPDVCNAFTQAASTAWSAGQGVGLGLYIASRLVAAHGGQLQIESTEGQGTVVSFTIPEGRVRTGSLGILPFDESRTRVSVE